MYHTLPFSYRVNRDMAAPNIAIARKARAALIMVTTEYRTGWF
ncbi:hypothetical protein [Thermoactinomyces mirandus]|nr:hypothetical protein [Thermoactinomyces mirandus]